MEYSSYFFTRLVGLGALSLVGCTSSRPASKALPVASVAPAASSPVAVFSAPAVAAPLYQSAAFTVWPDRVEQGPYVARAVSPTHLTSTYQSPANRTFNRTLQFKFALNGRDNELPVGVNHAVVLFPTAGQRVEAPVITFGKLLKQETPVPAGSFLEPDTRLKLRLDLRAVLAAFKARGYFETFNGQRINATEFKGVFVAGGSEPLGWDFDNLATRPQYQLLDPDGDGIYEIELLLNPGGGTKVAETREWKLTRDVSALPQYRSDQPLVDALWNLSLEEMLLDIRPDQTFMAGAKWDGVWTRDISYSIVLSLAYLRPDIAMNSLRRKVTADGRIIQDTGTGGAWPVSSDRMTWALAAWEVYVATGDEAWLRYAYDVVRKSLRADERVTAMANQLVRGESSFLDWRQQTYPRWMQPVDIYESRCLGTNVVAMASYYNLGAMADALGEKQSDHYLVAGDAIKRQIERQLWADKKGYYGQFLYGRPIANQLSDRWEALGEALAVLYRASPPEHATRIIKNAPALKWGVPTIWPGIPDVPPYHNQTMWPFVQAYWNWGLARNAAGDQLAHGLAALYRPAALFLTNKENLNAFDGDFKGTETNSDRQLWSVAGNLAMVTRVFFGMGFHPNSMRFDPCVPAAYGGEKTLTNFRYRGATLTVRLRGTGRLLKSATLDGQPLPPLNAVVPGTLTGAHEVVLELDDAPLPAGPPVRYVEPTTEPFALKEPPAVPATALAATAKPPQHVKAGPDQARPTGYTGIGYAVLSRTENRVLILKFKVPVAGRYALDFRYANGSGPVNTDNKCALRTLKLDGRSVGPVILPQRGAGEWSDWGFSSAQIVSLPAGEHTATLSF
ncbi:MAG: glycogen debranching protein, partial [Hymenobacteraceae bacterium]|nr:glycogen debranching protein [Hymenobacteraceae bacterium]